MCSASETMNYALLPTSTSKHCTESGFHENKRVVVSGNHYSSPRQNHDLTGHVVLEISLKFF